MNQLTYDKIQEVFQDLQSQKEEADRSKNKVLISLMQKLSADAVVKKLELNGLPKAVYLHPSAPIELTNCLSFFCKVYSSAHLEVGKIYFSWVLNYDTTIPVSWQSPIKFEL